MRIIDRDVPAQARNGRIYTNNATTINSGAGGGASSGGVAYTAGNGIAIVNNIISTAKDYLALSGGTMSGNLQNMSGYTCGTFYYAGKYDCNAQYVMNCGDEQRLCGLGVDSDGNLRIGKVYQDDYATFDDNSTINLKVSGDLIVNNIYTTLVNSPTAYYVHYNPTSKQFSYALSYFRTDANQNTYGGQSAGNQHTGTAATFYGYGAGCLNTANYNTYYGAYSGYYNKSGQFNTYIGYAAGDGESTATSGGTRCTALGHQALFKINNGLDNIAIGYQSAYNSKNEHDNISIGNYALMSVSGGSENIAIGTRALTNLTTGYDILAIGHDAGAQCLTGYTNTFIGIGAGNKVTGYGCVMLGFNAGYNEVGNNKLYIANSSTSTPLIGGDFAAKTLKVNGKLSADLTNSTGTQVVYYNAYTKELTYSDYPSYTGVYYPKTGGTISGWCEVTGSLTVGDTLECSKDVLIGDSFIQKNYATDKLFTVTFTNGVANQAVDILIPLPDNNSIWGEIEVEITSSWNYQNASGVLKKRFTVGCGYVTGVTYNIYQNSSKVVEKMGNTADNIAIGEFQFDTSLPAFKIPISHIVSTANSFYIRVKYFGLTNYNFYKNVRLSSPYTLTALAANKLDATFDKVGIGTTPSYALDVNSSTSGYAAQITNTATNGTAIQIRSNDIAINVVDNSYNNYVRIKSNGRIDANSNAGSGGYISSGNKDGTGQAAYFPSGIYSLNTNWIYGNTYFNYGTAYFAGILRDTNQNKWTIDSGNGAASFVTSTVGKSVVTGLGASNGLWLNWNTSGYASIYGSAASGNRYMYVAASDGGECNLTVNNGVVTASNVRKTSLIALSAGSTTWNLNDSCTANLQLTANSTLTITNALAGDTGILKIVQGGSYTLTLPSNSRKTRTYTASTGSNSIDIITFFYDGVSFYWNFDQKYV